MSEAEQSKLQSTIDPTADARMAVLRRFHILDTDRDAVFDGIAELASALLDAPIAIVNFIADNRQWFKAEIGIGQRELPLDVSICRVALPERGIFVVPDLTCDDRFSSNPLVNVAEGLRFYAGIVLEYEGVPIGTVCVLDTQPRIHGISNVQRRGLEALAVQAMAALERSATAARDRYRLKLTEQLLDAVDATAMMEAITEALGHYLGVAQVGLAEIEDNQAYAWVHRDWSDGRIASVVGRWHLDDFGLSFVRDIKNGTTVAIPDVMLDARTNTTEAAASFAGVGVRAMLTIPLFRNAQLRALLFAHHHEPRDWSMDEVTIVEETVGRLWAAVERARADERLLHSEAIARTRADQIEAIYSAAPVGLAMFDRDLRYVSINERLAIMNGAPAADHIGKTPREVIPGLGAQPELDAQLTETFNRALAGEAILGVQFSGTSAAQPGVVFSWRVNYLPMYAATGKIVGVVLSVEDITMEQAAQDALKASEARLTQAQDLGGIGSWEWNHVTDQGQVSPSYRRLHGLTRHDGPFGIDDLFSVMHPDDHAAFRASVEEGIAAGERFVVQYRVVLPSETAVRWIRGTGQRVGTDLPTVTAGIVEDITERRARNALVLAQAAELASLFAAAPVGLCVLDRDLRYMQMNDRLAGFSGISAADFIGKTPQGTLPQFDDQAAETMARVLAGESVFGAEFVGAMPNQPGVIRTWRANLVPLRGGGNKVVGITVAADEITDEKKAADELRHALELADTAQQAARAVLYEFDPVTGVAKPSPNFAQITGYPSDTKVSLEWWQALVHPDDLPTFRDTLEAAVTRGSDYMLEYRMRHNDGHWLWVSDRGRAVPIGDGLHRLVGMFLDIDEQRQGQQALAESEARYRAVFEQVGVGVARLSLDGLFIQLNDRFCTIAGHECEDLIGKSWQEITHPAHLAEDLVNRGQLLAGDYASFATETRFIGKDGREIWANLTLSLARDAADVPTFFVAMVEDISARKQAEAALSDSEAKMRTVLDAAPVGLVFADATGNVTHSNARFVEILGHPLKYSPDIDAYAEYISFHADGRQVEAREYPFAHVLSGQAERAELEMLYRRGDGRDIWVRAVAVALRSVDGTLLGAVGAMLDIDRETRLTQQLVYEVEHAVAERQTALAQLFEAQKLETIGQLTGGVAHDFNNLLTPIMGVLEMMQNRVAGEDRASRLVSGALQSAERAKNLIQRLLAFARRQHLETKAIDLAALIAGMRDLIAHSIGPTIAVEVALDDDIGPVNADANQLELALLNLSVNARDAMPAGGKLRFAARRQMAQVGNELLLGPGRYVCLTVSDTGSGMDADTVNRCIEPFFTSKGIGEGTGLGLSMVHGMMRQLGGALNIVSAPGQGTMMELWLCCSDKQVVTNDIKHALPIVATRRSTVLLVDDEELVRESTADMLDRLGYDVVQSSGGADALELLAGSNTIDALVTDYLMPGMTGRELAKQARRDRPDLPVLLITGHTRLDEIEPDFPRIEKPFRQADFAARMAELVGSS